VQRDVDPAARREKRWEERPRAQLGDLHRQVAHTGRHELVAGAVPPGHPRVGAFMQLSADVGRSFSVHHTLKHPAKEPAHELTAIGGAEHLDHLEQGRIIQGHRVESFSVSNFGRLLAKRHAVALQRPGPTRTRS